LAASVVVVVGTVGVTTGTTTTVGAAAGTGATTGVAADTAGTSVCVLVASGAAVSTLAAGCVSQFRCSTVLQACSTAALRTNGSSTLDLEFNSVSFRNRRD